ncbi:Cof-type HAD-IIB family hydrolase [Streptococcus himalayensis]|uniref:Haloacid dehalogenase n=1 Tax=Streptococcus himalayensis TaxID=1888195 RepID=A0A917EGY7_9STRE|nr:Cof-type HAD-IIB family hydrolase [Streptococcus himalayensis]GGE34955.1 haloacid dehalogenase [Streptococcus himalayensis]
MDIRVIATDMDGTLLDSRGEYPRERFEKIVTELEKREIQLVVATGNNISRMQLLFGDLFDRLSFVARNGSMIVERGKLLSQRFWTREMVEDCLTYFQGQFQAYRLIVGMEGKNVALEGTDFSYVYQLVAKESADAFLATISYIKDFTDLPEGAYLRVSLMIPERDVDEVTRVFNQAFKGKFRAVTSGYGSVDIIEEGIHKAWGLEQLLKRWQLSPSQLMAFGDSENDVELLQFAGQSYAMENGDQSAKIVANQLAPSNHQAGVLQVIENYLRER